MKRFVSLLLTICILGSLMLSMAGCGLFKKKIDSGTEAAKLLLANERLDENLLGEKIDIGITEIGKSSANTVQQEPLRVVLTSHTSTAPTATATSSSGHTWSKFPAESSSMDEFTQFMNGVEDEVENVAEDIAHMKNNVGVTDKWVKVGNDKQMLRVFENYDMLIVIDMYDDIHVYYRYTDENAKNVYEMFSFMSYDDGTTGEIRTMCIPGERYEYMFNTSEGITDYFIAENSRGYWMNTRFDYSEDEFGNRHSFFQPYIIKDGLGFGSALDMETFENGTSALNNVWYTVFDPASNRELFRVTETSTDYCFALYFPAIRDGLISVSATDVEHDETKDVYQTSALSSLTTKNGVYTAISEDDELPEGQFAFTSGYVQYLYFEEIYYGSIDFRIVNKQMSLDEACLDFSSYASSLGLELYCDMETVAASLEHASLLADGFGDSFEWNGYKMSSIENIEKANGVLLDRFKSARAAYEEVKDYETASSRQKLSNDAHFAELEIVAVGDNSFDGTSVVLSGISALTSDVALFEEGKEYVLKVGLSLLDDEGNPISVNTVALKGTEPVSVAFGGTSITLGTSGSYEIPKNLDSGDYAAVVYIATKDEGIRVSEIQKIAFLSIDEGEIESSAMYVEAIEQNTNLIVRYEIKNQRNITLDGAKETYSYDEIERAIMLEILTYGAPYRGAVLEYEDGTSIEEGASLSAGSYRMMCYLATSDGLAQSYVYLTVE